MSASPDRSTAPAAPAPATAGDRGMRRATTAALALGLLTDAVVVLVGALVAGQAAAVGALVGTGLALVVIVPTLVTAHLAPRLSAIAMAVTVLTAWGGKMVVVVVALLLLRDVEGVSFLWICLALLVGALSGLVIETALLARVRRPLDVTPADGGPEAPGEAVPETGGR